MILEQSRIALMTFPKPEKKVTSVKVPSPLFRSTLTAFAWRQIQARPRLRRRAVVGQQFADRGRGVGQPPQQRRIGQTRHPDRVLCRARQLGPFWALLVVLLPLAGALALVGWIDHYHGTVQVSKLSNGMWGAATAIGRGTAWSSFQEMLTLDAASGTVARAVWKNAKTGTQTMAASYGK